ncbi:MAG: trypsin-like peptidase domain-containing protein [Candidatus Rokubacteria bacterium]|nr:trypsin-like peptidase domain-containing protein [Candidatus Rokubacteria bacterium]
MRRVLIAITALAALATSFSRADAQAVGEIFKGVTTSVVVVRTRERDVSIQGPSQLVNVSGLGSGVLISPDGKVLTAAHVVQTVDEIRVEFLGGEVVGATVVASEPEADVALLQLQRVPPGALVARLGDSDRVEVGDQVLVIGAPYGIGHTLTVGHISARHKPNTVYSGMSLAEFLQTDAAINQGNSGGPMFSMAGEVIGIVSHIISKSGGFEGLGFVVTSNMARRLLLERRSFWSGLDGYVLAGNLARVFNLPQPVGLLVQRVAERSPSALIGLRGGTMKATIDGQSLTVGGDIVLEVQGIPITGRTSYESIQERLGRLHPGALVTITVLREGRLLELIGRLP